MNSPIKALIEAKLLTPTGANELYHEFEENLSDLSQEAIDEWFLFEVIFDNLPEQEYTCETMLPFLEAMKGYLITNFDRLHEVKPAWLEPIKICGQEGKLLPISLAVTAYLLRIVMNDIYGETIKIG